LALYRTVVQLLADYKSYKLVIENSGINSDDLSELKQGVKEEIMRAHPETRQWLEGEGQKFRWFTVRPSVISFGCVGVLRSVLTTRCFLLGIPHVGR